MIFTEEVRVTRNLILGNVAYYDGVVYVDLSTIKPMIAMPFHPSNTYTIEELNANLEDILHDVEKKALVSLDGQVEYKLTDKIKNGRFYVDQGIIAGCAGGGFENICAAADILKGKSIGADEFTLSVYPASTPIYVELARNGRLADLMETGAIVKTAFCGYDVLVQEIHLLIMHSQSDIQQETSLTEKVLNYRMDRYHLLHLWMHVLLQQQQLIRDTLQQQQTWM